MKISFAKKSDEWNKVYTNTENEMRKQYFVLWNWSNEQSKLHIVQKNHKICVLLWAVYGTDAMYINHKSHQFEWLFEHLKIHFLEQVICIALNGQRKVFLSMISGMSGSGV